jgi:thiol:disulfide interchange protein
MTRLFTLIATLVTLLSPGLSLAQPESPVTVTGITSRTHVAPGDRFVVAVVLTHKDGWKTNTNAPKVPKEWGDFEPIPTTLTPKLPPGIVAGTIQWPEPHMIEMDLVASGRPQLFGVFSEISTIYVPLLVAADFKPGKVQLQFDTDFQACKELCLAPELVEVVIGLEVVQVGDSRLLGTNAPPEFAKFDASSLADESTWGSEGAVVAASQPKESTDRLKFSVFGKDFDLSTKGVGFIGILFLGFIGGLLLNVMPCVLPVIPLKIMGLANSAGSRSRLLFLGLMMSLGVVTFWVVIGGIIAASTNFKSAAQLFSYWWVGVAMGVFILAMGLGMLGAFSVGLPNWIYSLNPKQETAAGAFGFGILTAILAAPCVAPFGGAALGWAAFQPAPVAMTLFGVIGLGMALPYFVLAANPAWVQKLPRTGPASDLIKQILAILMLAVAAFFIGSGLLTLTKDQPHVSSVLYWWIVTALCFVAAGWLILRTWAITRSFGRRAFFSGLAIMLAAGSFAWSIDQAVRDGKVVVLDFTADWCLNCKSLKAVVLNDSDVVAALSQPDVNAFEIDLSARKAPGWERLRGLGQAGIPLLVVYGPGLPKPWTSNLYTAKDVLAALQSAKGSTQTTQNQPAGLSTVDSPRQGG